MNFAHCLHIVLVIGKYTNVFSGDFYGGGRGLRGRIFPRRNSSRGERISMKGALDSPALFKQQ